jgi:hypothetical protein
VAVAVAVAVLGELLEATKLVVAVAVVAELD